jgi:hypothetical protein
LEFRVVDAVLNLWLEVKIRNREARRSHSIGIIGDLNSIFIPNVLKFGPPYDTINRGFLFSPGRSQRGYEDLGKIVSTATLNLWV